ncbi:glycosyltransferase [Terrihabitans sp. B22-R8]|uniref:glycosyltransferase n=1 Tax=Terrihabitans sp. B22-R8 TaxID=3425128 RepID=UPI00403D25DD
MSTPDQTGPRIAVVVPTYRQPGLLAEALSSVCAQDCPFEIAVLVIDDGCPDPDTALVSAMFAEADARIRVIRQDNRGLSGARNRGIAAALAWPSVEALFFLDSDNALTPSALRTAMAELDAHPEADWIYSPIDRFGMAGSGHYDVPYSSLTHRISVNVCEIGSLVRRRVFDAGVLFDETMRQGYEDWDFWLQAIAQGFRGRPCRFGFDYRRRAESMLSGAARSHDALTSHLKTRHAALYDPRGLMRQEHGEVPRFAITADGGTFLLATDPDLPARTIDRAEFVRLFHAGRIEPEREDVPPFLLILPPRALDDLRQARLLHSTLALLERAALDEPFAVPVVLSGSPNPGLRLGAAAEGESVAADGWFIATERLISLLGMVGPARFEALFPAAPLPAGRRHVRIAIPSRPQPTAPSKALGALWSSISHSPSASAGSRWAWRERELPRKRDLHGHMRRVCRAEVLLPRIGPANGPPQVGFVLPFASFGGVERATFCVAKALTARGVDCHLYLLHSDHAPAEMVVDGPFRSVTFLADPNLPIWGGPHRIDGHDVALEYDDVALSERLRGLLLGLDAVINCHAFAANRVIGSLRQAGVLTACYLHVVDRTPSGRPVGHPYVGAAFEQAYDLVLGCSEQVLDLVSALGVPRSKCLHIPNAPVIRPEESGIEGLRRHRSDTAAPSSFGVLFLGRLDRQKGIDRLLAIVRETRERVPDIRWRVIGAPVLDGGGEDWPAQFAQLGVEIEPPTSDPERLAALYRGSHVLVQPSRWEGVPLAVLEAQAFGCVPVASDVGALREAVIPGTDGLLIEEGPEAAMVEGFARAICDLADSPARWRALSLAALERGRQRSWDASAAALADRLHARSKGA